MFFGRKSLRFNLIHVFLSDAVMESYASSANTAGAFLMQNGVKTFCPFWRRSISDEMYSIERCSRGMSISIQRALPLFDLLRIPAAIISYLLSISSTLSTKEETKFTKAGPY